MNSEALPLAVADMKTKLQDEVLGPLEQWLSAYRTIKVWGGWLSTLSDIPHCRNAPLPPLTPL